jgi:hypothetical protein
MKLAHLLKGKLLVATLLSITVASGTTAVFAATPAGRGAVHAIMAMAHAQAALHRDGHHTSDHKAAGRKNSTCPGLPEAQQLAAKFALSTDRDGDAVQAMCALHQGTFVGTTPAGASVSSQQVFGYGEIDKLLAYAQFLATHDKANASGKLTGSNVRSYLALALQHCGTTSLERCLKTKVQPGNSGSQKGGNGHGHKHGNSYGHG